MRQKLVHDACNMHEGRNIWFINILRDSRGIHCSYKIDLHRVNKRTRNRKYLSTSVVLQTFWMPDAPMGPLKCLFLVGKVVFIWRKSHKIKANWWKARQKLFWTKAAKYAFRTRLEYMVIAPTCLCSYNRPALKDLDVVSKKRCILIQVTVCQS